MIKVVTIDTVCELLQKHGFKPFILDLLKNLREDFAAWDSFHKIPRPAAHSPNGVIELMPIWNDELYSYKYVNGHPANTQKGKLNVVALGQLCDMNTGYPLMFSEMTLLTALRTAAMAALAAQLLARKNSKTLAVIGTGAQSEFQVLAHHAALGIDTVRYVDLDQQAMQKFAHNLDDKGLKLIACRTIDEAIEGADIIVTLTAAKKEQHVLQDQQIKAGVHINAFGGDSPGKTELDPKILTHAKVVVEFFEQSHIEGEIQHFPLAQAKKIVYAELAEIVSGQKPGRTNDTEITVFDSVGFAIEDFAILRLVYRLCEQYGLGELTNLIPDIKDPKDLFGILVPSPNLLGEG